MRHSSVIVFIAVCASAIPSSRSQDFSSCPNLTTDITGCSTEFLHGIAMGEVFTDFTKGLNLTSATSGSLCQSSTKTAILDFYGCLYEKIFLTCLSSDWQKVLPSLDQRKQSFDYMCDNINDVDIACVGTTENARALLNCLQQGTKGGFNLSTPDGYLAFVCSATQRSESCTTTAYGSCPKRTAEVLVEMDKLTRPAGCDACVSKPSLLLLASVLAFMLGLFK